MTKHHYAQGAGIAAPAKKPRSQTLTPRLHRALSALVERSHVECKELGIIAGQLNYAQVCSSLRDRLGRDAIRTGTMEVIDRDGRRCNPGYYELAAEARPAALRLLQGGCHA